MTLTLHGDVLEEVFMHYMTLTEDPIIPLYKPYARITVSHVCGHWRTVALQCSRLWSYIFLTSSHALIEEVLRRSRQHLLDVVIDVFPKPGKPVIPFTRFVVAAEYGRVRSLHIHISTDKSFQASQAYLEEFFNTPARQLRTLYLKHGLRDLQGRSDPRFSLPKGYLERAPHLERLTLVNLRCRWSNLSLTPSLRHLHLSYYRTSASQPGIAQSLDILGQMQLLEKLEVWEGCHRQNRSLVAFPMRNIILPHLEYLVLDVEARQCAHVLTYLSAPSLRGLTVHFRRCPDEDDNLASSVAPHCTKLPGMNSIHLICGDDNLACIRGYELSADVIDLCESSSRYPFGDLDTTLEVAFHTRNPFFYPGNAWPHLPFRHDVRLLMVEGYLDYVECPWQELFGHLEGLTTLRICGSCGSLSLLEALSVEEDDIDASDRRRDTSGRPSQLLLPRLNTLDITSFEKDSFYDTYRRMDKHGRWFNGAPLKRLRFPKWADLDPCDILDFKMYVSEVKYEDFELS